MKQSAAYPQEFATAVLHKHLVFAALALAYDLRILECAHSKIPNRPGEPQLHRPTGERGAEAPEHCRGPRALALQCCNT